VVVVEPDGQQIKIAQVRQLTARAAFRPHEGRARVVILDPADALGAEAANALLKTLEEPPADTHFILCSAAPDRLPITVRSRCQRVRFVPLGEDALERLVTARLGVSAEDARAAAALAEGSLSRALELAQAGTLASRRAAAAKILLGAASPRTREILRAAVELKDERDELPSALELLRLAHRDALQTAVGAKAARSAGLEPAEMEALTALGPGALRRRMDAVLEAEASLRANINAQLCLERLMMRLREC
jgi:DNA polymerase-3 subunit delta'